ncbi:MAG TPA: PKD domain-containing protein [Thermoplasmatales archaeon]|nr:PKD domain-containing protein [Thermoplasmatales archaeon]
MRRMKVKVLGVAALLALLALTASTLGDEGQPGNDAAVNPVDGIIQVSTNKSGYAHGEPVPIVISNVGAISLGGSPFLDIYNDTGPVFSVSVDDLPSFLDPGESFTYVWEQRNTEGRQVSGGSYVASGGYKTGCCIEGDDASFYIEHGRQETWMLETVEALGKIGYDTDISVDADDHIHISYYDFGVADLKYACWKNGEWSVQNVDTAGDAGLYSSLAVDADGVPHISYYDATNQDLKYAVKENGAWATEAVDTAGDAGSYTDTVIDANGNVHVSYYATTDRALRYARRVSNAWDTEDVATDIRVYGTTAIALDSQQSPHLCYYDLTSYTTWYLKYARRAARGWEIEVVDPNLYYFWNPPGAGIAIDKQDRIHIGYAAWKQWNLNYAWKAGDEWNLETVDSEGDVDGYASLALDSRGYPHISYVDRSNSALKHANKIQYEPDTPAQPTGPATVRRGRDYTYTTSTIDFDGDEIRFGWDWNGDGMVDEWTGFYTSGQEASVRHSWDEQGTYAVRVMAEDSTGRQSDWSPPLSISVPYVATGHHLLLRLLLSWIGNGASSLRPLILSFFFL